MVDAVKRPCPYLLNLKKKKKKEATENERRLKFIQRNGYGKFI